MEADGQLTARHIDYAELDVPLRLRTPTGHLDVTASSLAFVSDDGEVVECISELQLDLPGYRTVDAERLFHLDPEIRGPGADGFAPEGAVQLEVRLEPELLAILLSESSVPKDAGEHLGELSGAGESPLLSTDAWYALKISTPMALPDELAQDGGSLQVGYSTRWAGDDGPTLELTMLAIVEQLLDDRGWQTEASDDDDVIAWRMHNAHGGWGSYALAREIDDRLSIYSVLDLTFGPDRLHDGALLITRANQGLPIGNWELDLDDGTVRYKTSLELGGEGLSMPLAGCLIERNLAVVDAYLEAFVGFAEGRLSVAEALALSEG